MSARQDQGRLTEAAPFVRFLEHVNDTKATVDAFHLPTPRRLKPANAPATWSKCICILLVVVDETAKHKPRAFLSPFVFLLVAPQSRNTTFFTWSRQQRTKILSAA